MGGKRFVKDGRLMGLFRRGLSENDSSRKSMTLQLLPSEGDGTRTRNHRIDSPVL
jgi:hypothetical protein